MVVQLHDNVIMIAFFIYLMNMALFLIIPPEICDIEGEIFTVPEINVSTAQNPFVGLTQVLINIFNFFINLVSGNGIAQCLPQGFGIFYRILIGCINLIVTISVGTWIRSLV